MTALVLFLTFITGYVAGGITATFLIWFWLRNLPRK